MSSRVSMRLMVFAPLIRCVSISPTSKPSETRSTCRSTMVISGITLGCRCLNEPITGASRCMPNMTGATILNEPIGSWLSEASTASALSMSSITPRICFR